MAIQLQKGLVGHWTMDSRDTDSGMLRDRSAYDKHGTLNGGVTTGDSGIVADSYNFDGTDDYIDVGDVVLEPPFAICGWGKQSTSGNYRNMLNVNYNGTESDLIEFRKNDNDVWELLLDDGSNRSYAQSTSTINDGNWHHYIGMFLSDGTIELYVDSQIVDSVTIASSDTVSGPLDIGMRGNDFWFDGNIDDVRFYNRKLTDEEINALYQIRSPRTKTSRLQKGLVGHWTMDNDDTDGTTHHDKSATGNHGALSGGITTGDTGIINEAFTFDGTDDKVTLSREQRLEDFPLSFSLWIKPTRESDSEAFLINEDGSVPAGWRIYRPSAASLSTLIRDSSTHAFTSHNVVTGEWDHQATVITSSKVTTYTNGQQVDSSTHSVSFANMSNPDFVIGGVVEAQGSIDDVRVYDRELTQSEINRIYQLRS